MASLNWPLLIDSLVSPSGAFKRDQFLGAGLVLAYLRAGFVLNCHKHFEVGLVLRLAGGQSYIFRQSFVGQSYYKWLDFKIEAPKRDANIQFSGSLVLAKAILNGWISKSRPLKEMPLYKSPTKKADV